MIGLLENHLRYRAELIVDSVIESGRCEFVTDLAAELPLQAIADIMGVPNEERYLLFDWTNKMVGADDPEYVDDVDSGDEATAAAAELYLYATQLREKRAKDPRDDIVTKLINAEIDGDRLTEAEFDMFILLLAVAGNETTRNATAHGMHALLTHPEQFAALARRPRSHSRRGRGDREVGVAGASFPSSGHTRHGASWETDHGGRQGRDVARLGESRRGGLR